MADNFDVFKGRPMKLVVVSTRFFVTVEQVNNFINDYVASEQGAKRIDPERFVKSWHSFKMCEDQGMKIGTEIQLKPMSPSEVAKAEK